MRLHPLFRGTLGLAVGRSISDSMTMVLISF